MAVEQVHENLKVHELRWADVALINTPNSPKFIESISAKIAACPITGLSASISL